MSSLHVETIVCEACVADLSLRNFAGACSSCGQQEFRVEFRSINKGIDADEIAEPLIWTFVGGDIGLALYLLREGALPSPLYRSENRYQVGGLTGSEVLDLLSKSGDDLKRLVGSFKRREGERSLDPGRGLCRRCGVVFRRYGNPWNAQTFCSRKCQEKARLVENNRARSGLQPPPTARGSNPAPERGT